MESFELIKKEGSQAFINGKSILDCPYEGKCKEREIWMLGYNEEERGEMNFLLRWLTGDSKLAIIVGWILFFVIIAVVFNSYVFISEYFGLPWNSRGIK